MTLCIRDETLSVLIVYISISPPIVCTHIALAYNVCKMYAKRFFLCEHMCSRTIIIQEQEDEWIRGMAYTTSRIQQVVVATIYSTVVILVVVCTLITITTTTTKIIRFLQQLPRIRIST